MKNQQQSLRDACMLVLGRIPSKGEDAKAAFTVEVREKLADVMCKEHAEGLVNDPSKRTTEDFRKYVVGTGNTCLCQNWTIPVVKKEKSGSGSDLTSKIAALKVAVDAGLMTQADAAAIVAGLLK